jgi:hypothetical protein
MLTPPLKGNWTLSKILKWLYTSSTSLMFVPRCVQWCSGHPVHVLIENPSLPHTLLDSTPSNQKVLHRVLYRTLSESHLERTPYQQLIKLEMEFSMSDLARSNASGLEHSDSDRELAGDLPVDVDHDASSPLDLFQDSAASEEPSLDVQQTSPQVSVNVSDAVCLEGIESTLDVMMPDRFVNSRV